MDTLKVWAYNSTNRPIVWFSHSGATIHVSPKQEDFSSYQMYNKECIINTFGNNMVKGEGECDIDADIEYGGKTMRIHLT